VATRKILGGDYGAADTVNIDADAERMPVHKSSFPRLRGKVGMGAVFSFPPAQGAQAPGATDSTPQRKTSFCISPEGKSMLKPSQFTPNDAWILFRLNDRPISTEQDGGFNVLCLMDAASLYILTNEFVPVDGEAAIADVAKKLLAAAESKAGKLPEKIFVSAELQSSDLEETLEETGFEVVVSTKRELQPFVSEAKRGFRAHLERGGLR